MASPCGLKFHDLGISLQLFFGGLNIETSDSPLSRCFLDIGVGSWASANKYALITDSPEVEIVIKLTICLVNMPIHDPDLVSLIIRVMSLSAQVTSIGAGILDLNGVIWESFLLSLTCLPIGKGVGIVETGVFIVNVKLALAVILVISHFQLSLPWPYWHPVFVHKPLVWLRRCLHSVPISVSKFRRANHHSFVNC